jgi:3-hydroxyacyl-CoA dehydrogenase
MTRVLVENRAGVAVISIANPPVNAFSVRAGVVDALGGAVSNALRDSSITALVIAGHGAMFCAGADIADFDDDPAELERVRSVLNDIEKAAKPVIVALHNVALGAGLELAMVGHYRIAARSTKLGLPEITLGILPGAGGTQRLPRLIGVLRALELMMSGKPVDAEEALSLGLIDRVFEGDPVTAALQFIAERSTLVPRRTRDIALPADGLKAVADARSRLNEARSLNVAPARILDCVEVALTSPLEEGLALEARLFQQLLLSEASLGLRHAFVGRPQVARIPHLPDHLKHEHVASVAVVGAGLMGAGIAMTLLNADLTVTLIEKQSDALAAAVKRIRAAFARDIQKGRLSQETAAYRLGCLIPATTIDAAADADLVIEAVFEEIDVKRAVFGELDRVAKHSAILASNTSGIDLNVIAGFTGRPERVVGLHFFSPANIMKLVEVVRGAATAPEVLATAMAFVKKIGKVGVVAGVCDGFIGNRIFEEYLRQAYFLIEEGALPQQVDRALENWGMAMGPFRTMDLAGQDVGRSVRKRRAITDPGRPYSPIPDLICEMGRFGQKTGKGFYLYRDARTAEVDPEIDALVIAYSQTMGIERRAVGDTEIIERCLLSMVNEGARVLAQGIAYRPVDIDILYLNGYGFPAERGGPMFQADRIGLPDVLAKIEKFAAASNGWCWTPAQLLVDLVARHATFGSLNQ